MTVVSTINSTIKGKAYEYACILALKEIVEPIRSIEVVENSSLTIARNRYENDITQAEQSNMLLSAKAGINTIITMEPRIIEDGEDVLTLSLQSDKVAVLGDIRDVLIIRRSIEWEIGISVKHNHEALKHSRLSKILDFGKSWYDICCDQSYFDAIQPLFDDLQRRQSLGEKWRDLADKEKDVYVPLLTAFMAELQRATQANASEVVSGLVKYLLGSNGNDYYKLIHHNNHTVRVIPYSFYGKLNQDSIAGDKPTEAIQTITLPTRIIDMSFKPESKTTVVLTMDEGWAISFRIHNASTNIEPSLKFDVQLVGQPASLFYIDTKW